MAAVSIEDIQEMAKKYIKPNNALILAVGDVAKLKEQLKQFSPNTEIIEYNFYGDVVK